MGRYFSIAELTRSASATQQGIDNTPPPAIEAKLALLIERLLDPVRERWGGPICVNSGYRCPELNRAVGGVATSQHCSGEAADISAGTPERNRALFEMIAASDLPFDQLIDESRYTWVHVSFGPRARRQVLHL